MPPRKSAHATPADTSAAVDAFMATLEHPHRDAVTELRRIVTGVDGTVREGIKWNAPSWRTSEYFATTHLRSKAGVGLVLHLGAKARALPEGGLVVPDPANLLTWLGPDRAMVQFTGLADLQAKRKALVAVLEQWIHYV